MTFQVTSAGTIRDFDTLAAAQACFDAQKRAELHGITWTAWVQNSPWHGGRNARYELLAVKGGR